MLIVQEQNFHTSHSVLRQSASTHSMMIGWRWLLQATSSVSVSVGKTTQHLYPHLKTHSTNQHRMCRCWLPKSRNFTPPIQFLSNNLHQHLHIQLDEGVPRCVSSQHSLELKKWLGEATFIQSSLNVLMLIVQEQNIHTPHPVLGYQHSLMIGWRWLLQATSSVPVSVRKILKHLYPQLKTPSSNHHSTCRYWLSKSRIFTPRIQFLEINIYTFDAIGWRCPKVWI